MGLESIYFASSRTAARHIAVNRSAAGMTAGNGAVLTVRVDLKKNPRWAGITEIFREIGVKDPNRCARPE